MRVVHTKAVFMEYFEICFLVMFVIKSLLHNYSFSNGTTNIYFSLILYFSNCNLLQSTWLCSDLLHMSFLFRILPKEANLIWNTPILLAKGKTRGQCNCKQNFCLDVVCVTSLTFHCPKQIRCSSSCSGDAEEGKW